MLKMGKALGMRKGGGVHLVGLLGASLPGDADIRIVERGGEIEQRFELKCEFDLDVPLGLLVGLADLLLRLGRPLHRLPLEG